MRFLRTQDYYRQIQPQNLQQIIEGDENLLLAVEQSAQAEMISYLTQRYDVNKIFTDTPTFNITTSYNENDRVEYTEPSYFSGTNYTAGNRVSFSGSIYQSISGSTNIQPITGVSSWNYVTQDKQLFYTIQSGTTSGITPDNTAYFLQADNRPQQVLLFLIDIVLYHLHCRIAPQNVPMLRMVRYDNNGANQKGGAIGWLKMCADGSINAGLPEKYLPQANGNGLSIQWGSAPSNNNFY